MSTLRLEDLKQYSDVLRTRQGEPLNVRFIEPRDTEELQHYWDKHASSYDREMAFMERWLFAGGREWVCRQAVGDVLEVAIGTGRNLRSLRERASSPSRFPRVTQFLEIGGR